MFLAIITLVVLGCLPMHIYFLIRTLTLLNARKELKFLNSNTLMKSDKIENISNEQ